MFSYVRILTVGLAASVLGLAPQYLAADDNVVFRSDVSLVRVDASVVDRDNRAIAGLRADDFVLRESGRTQPIRNFASEEMPIDLLFLVDVSRSMRPHVQRMADATHQAVRVLRDNDRVGIMVFDRDTRVRLALRNGSRRDVEREMESLLRHESFNGGTDITRAMLDAADYMGNNGRRDARRAVVILTDDETEYNRDEDRVVRALARADTVMSALIAPDAMRYRSGGGQRYPQGGGGGGWPGGVIFGPQQRGPYGGRGGQQGQARRTQSAGTSQIARDSGGDSMPVDGAYALEDTLTRIRQRYALYFMLPAGARAGDQRSISVSLADAATRRYPYAEVRYRRDYYVPSGVTPSSASPDSTVISSTSAPTSDPDRPIQRRRGVSQNDGDSPVPNMRPPDPAPPAPSQAPAPAAASSSPAAAPPASQPPAQQPAQGRWRKVAPGDQQQQQE
jgi:VWFA-related protein